MTKFEMKKNELLEQGKKDGYVLISEIVEIAKECKAGPEEVKKFQDELNEISKQADIFGRSIVFIYQGEEIGMCNFERTSIDDFDDINSHAQYHRAMEEGYSKEEALHFLNLRSRDNTRTPMHWNDKEYAGFSDHQRAHRDQTKLSRSSEEYYRKRHGDYGDQRG